MLPSHPELQLLLLTSEASCTREGARRVDSGSVSLIEEKALIDSDFRPNDEKRIDVQSKRQEDYKSNLEKAPSLRDENSRRINVLETSKQSNKVSKLVNNKESLTHLLIYSPAKLKAAFTLAEILITLGIIGIIAALTIPNLIHNYRISVVETSLKRFYSTMNEAVRLSEIDNGSKMNWSESIYNQVNDGWFNQYFKPYIKTLKKSEVKIIPDPDGSYQRRWLYVYFADGTVVRVWSIHDFQYCLKEKYFDDIEKSIAQGRCFMFGFYPKREEYADYYYKKGIEPYVSNQLIHGVEDISSNPGYYAKRIQLNGWKVPDELKDNIK